MCAAALRPIDGKQAADNAALSRAMCAGGRGVASDGNAAESPEKRQHESGNRQFKIIYPQKKETVPLASRDFSM
jgi:hypothetical protein